MNLCFVLTLVLISSTNVKAADNYEKSDYIGFWLIEVPDAPYEYQKCILNISSKNNKLTAKVEGVDTPDNIVLNNDKLSFGIYVDGEYVDVMLTNKVNKISGTVSTLDGEMNVFGTKLNYLGKWSVDVPDAPYEYQNSDLNITNISGKLKVEVDGLGSATNPKLANDGGLSFKLYVDGESVNAKLMIKGDKLTGKAMSSEGTMNINGVRK